MKTLPILLLPFLVILLGCKTNAIKDTSAMSADFEIAVNDQFEIELTSNSTTGYSWQWANREAVEIIDSVGHEYIADRPQLTGSGGREIWKFLGVRPGIDTIKMEYLRPWDANSTAETKKVVVRVK
jgi:predicted secreted protein